MYKREEKEVKEGNYASSGLRLWLSGEDSACNAGDIGSILDPWRSPGVGNGNPLQKSCLGNPMDRGAWWATVLGIPRVGDNLAATHTHHLHTHTRWIDCEVHTHFFFPMPYLWHIYIFSVRDRKPLNFQSHIFKKIMKYHVISPLQRPSKMC